MTLLSVRFMYWCLGRQYTAILCVFDGGALYTALLRDHGTSLSNATSGCVRQRRIQTNPYTVACVMYLDSHNHLSGPRVDVRQVDAAGFEVDDEHGEAYPRQRGKLVESQSTDLDSVDRVVWLRTADREGEVLIVEPRDSFLQRWKTMMSAC